MRNPSLRQLEALVAVIETGTVSAAAEVLRISQPAASKLIRDLEADTQLELFERDSGRLLPTGRGMRLYEEVARIFGGVNQLARAVEGIRREERGELLIGVMPGFSGPFMGRVLARFRQEYPDVFVLVDSHSSQFLTEAVLLRRLDAVIITSQVEHAAVRSESVQLAPMVCVMQKGHPLAKRKSVSAKDIGNTPFVGFGSTSRTRRTVEAAFKDENQPLNVVIEASTSQNVAEFVAQGFGITVARAAFFESVKARVEIRPFLPTQMETLNVLRPVRARNTVLLDSFVNAVRFAAEEAVWST